jgi:hypothetical protein
MLGRLFGGIWGCRGRGGEGGRGERGARGRRGWGWDGVEGLYRDAYRIICRVCGFGDTDMEFLAKDTGLTGDQLSSLLTGY